MIQPPNPIFQAVCTIVISFWSYSAMFCVSPCLGVTRPYFALYQPTLEVMQSKPSTSNSATYATKALDGSPFATLL